MIWWKRSLLWVIFLSLYAIWITHAAAMQAAKAAIAAARAALTDRPESTGDDEPAT